MNCSEARYYTPLKLSGELEGALLHKFDAHLFICPSCRQNLRDDTDLDISIRNASDERWDFGHVEARVLATIRSEGTPESRRRPLIWGLGMAAAVLTMVIGLAFYLFPERKSPLTIYRDAADDHRAEVAGHMKLKWEHDPGAILALVSRVGGTGILTEQIAPPGFHLDRARICKLLSHRYVHLVYSDGQREVSYFVRSRNGEELTGSPALEVNGKAIHVDTVRDLQVAGFQSDSVTVLLVSDEPVQQVLDQITVAAGKV